MIAGDRFAAKVRHPLWLLVIACLCGPAACAPATIDTSATATTRWVDAVEVFGIGARAYVDANNNGLIDDGDSPLADATFTVIDATGQSVRMRTGAGGYAVGRPFNDAYPVTLRMEPPPGYQAIGPNEVTWSKEELVRNDLGTEFLFAAEGQ